MRRSPLFVRTVGLIMFALMLGVAGRFSKTTEADSLTAVTATLSNSRPSFFGELEGAQNPGTTLVTIDSTLDGTPTFPNSTSTDVLAFGDTLTIGDTVGGYTITSITSGTTFNIDTALAATDDDDRDIVVSTQSAQLSVALTTANAVTNGKFRILVPAVADSNQSTNGMPDVSAWDFKGDGTDVTCPGDVTGFTFGSPTFTASVTYDSATYHEFECPYTGAGAVGEVFSGTGDEFVIGDTASDLLTNPAKTDATGTADSYKVVVQLLDGSDNVIDSTSVAVGVIEAVRVTAEVPPQITFTIAGVNSGITSETCAVSGGTDVTTTANTVPLGELSISAFTYAAQTLTVSTNSVDGYSVTAVMDDQLRTASATCTDDADESTDSGCIGDSAGDSAAMTHTVSDEWVSTATKGFGYSIDNDDAGTVPFQYSTATGNCSGTFCARHFADAEDSDPENPVEIFSHTTVADSQNVNVCYAAIVSATQAADENYQSTITYTATATF